VVVILYAIASSYTVCNCIVVLFPCCAYDHYSDPWSPPPGIINLDSQNEVSVHAYMESSQNNK